MRLVLLLREILIQNPKGIRAIFTGFFRPWIIKSGKDMRKFIAVCISTVLLLPRLAFGWGAAGHEVIAAQAYRELSPEFKAETH